LVGKFEPHAIRSAPNADTTFGKNVPGVAAPWRARSMMIGVYLRNTLRCAASLKSTSASA